MSETTVDHLDFIRIRGLQSSDSEVFQGAAGGGTSSVTPGDPTEWVGIPEEIIEALSTYTDDLNTWLEGMNEEATARGMKSREVTDLVPYIPNVIGGVGAIVGTGGAALPAIGAVMLSQVVSNLIGQAIQNYLASKDPNNPANILKKAFLYDEDGDEYKSILKKALLYELSNTQESALKDKLEALQYNDEEVDFGPFKVHLRGKVLDY